jgi:hypothetical protein
MEHWLNEHEMYTVIGLAAFIAFAYLIFILKPEDRERKK